MNEDNKRGVIRSRLVDSLAFELPVMTPRDAVLPGVPGKAHAVIGMRRAGKTFFLFQQMARLLAEGVERSRLIYLNLEDERLGDIEAGDLHWIEDEYFAMYPEHRADRTYMFLDEVQCVSGWERYIRRILDSESIDVFFSGSSARLLSREIATSMRGRSLATVIYPYSFREFLIARGELPPERPDRFEKGIRSYLRNRLHHYLVEGGFPESLGLADRDRNLLLQEYVNSVMYRDIIERYHVSNTTVLRHLVRYLIANSGARFTVNNFFGHLKSQRIAVGKDTLHEYLAHLEDAFVIDRVFLHTASERRRMVNPCKPYVIDPGLVSAFTLRREPDLGQLLETVVFLELRRRGATVAYGRTDEGHEIDFVVQYPDGAVQLLQVSVDVSDPRTRERECRPLRTFEMPGSERLLISLGERTDIESPLGVIRVRPAWEWLLG